jgi:hypothetical protein
MGVSPGNHPAVPRDWFRVVPERYVAGADTRGHQEGRPYPWSQQVIHERSGLLVQAGQHLFLRGELLLPFGHHLLSLPAAKINFFFRFFYPRALDESLGHSIGLIIRVLPRRMLHKIG